MFLRFSRLPGAIVAVTVLMTLATMAPGAGRLFVSGQLVWSNGVPAPGMRVSIVQNGRTGGTTFSDVSGRFAFYDLPGTPQNYRINVMSADGTIADLQIGNIPVGGKIPAIVLK